MFTYCTSKISQFEFKFAIVLTAWCFRLQCLPLYMWWALCQAGPLLTNPSCCEIRPCFLGSKDAVGQSAVFGSKASGWLNNGNLKMVFFKPLIQYRHTFAKWFYINIWSMSHHNIYRNGLCFIMFCCDDIWVSPVFVVKIAWLPHWWQSEDEEYG